MNKLKVLIVDDWQGRHDRIKREVERWYVAEWRHRFGPSSVTDDDLSWAQLAFLDHDMCQRGFSSVGGIFAPDDDRPCPSPIVGGTNMLDAGCGCPTGMDLVRRMAEGRSRPIAVVHTANHVASPSMVWALRDAGFRVMAMPASRWAAVSWRGSLRLVLGEADLNGGKP